MMFLALEIDDYKGRKSFFFLLYKKARTIITQSQRLKIIIISLYKLKKNVHASNGESTT